MGQKRLRALLTHFFTLSGKALTALPAPPKGRAFSHLPVSTNKAVRALYLLLNPESQRLFADTFTLACSPSQALTRQIPLFVTCGDIFPRSGGSLSSKGEPLAVPANFISLPRPLPLGEVDLRSKDGEGEVADHVQQTHGSCLSPL